jgi:hypothetical protein
MALGNVTIEDATLVLRNFTGKAGDFNAEGDRNVGVILPDDLAQAMIEDGWPVKQFKAREEGEIGSFWIPASVKYIDKNGDKVRTPPRVVMITQTKHGLNRTPLGEGEVEMLDWMNIKSADVIIRPYEYVVSGRAGVKAYVQSLFVNVELDELEQKYADVPVAGSQMGNAESYPE